MIAQDGKSGDSAAYEERDLGFGAALWFTVSFVAATVLLVAGLTLVAAGVWQPFAAKESQRPFARPAEGPRLQEDPSSDLATLRRKAATRLQSFGWVDRERGIARIPIEEAMKLQAERARNGGRQ